MRQYWKIGTNKRYELRTDQEEKLFRSARTERPRRQYCIMPSRVPAWVSLLGCELRVSAREEGGLVSH